jgi:D-alanine-D-alanine ligase
MKKKVVILHNQILNNTPDEIDVLAQRDLVMAACINLGYDVSSIGLGDDLQQGLKQVTDEKADIVFNLVEATWGKGELIYFAPAMLNSMKIPYSGVPLDALFVTTNKVLAKKLMRFNKLPTADFFSIDELHKLNPQKTYIAKPLWEEASVGISSDFIFQTSDSIKLDKIKRLSAAHYFIEEFIDGREFNVSMLAGKNGPEVLSPAEMMFSSYFDDKPKIVGYKAKWDESSEEYKSTTRSFGTLANNTLLDENLTDICIRCWQAFNLHGYVRVDFRVDKDDRVFILEINGNPCIAPDSGFVAAINEAGYTNEDMIKRILADLN